MNNDLIRSIIAPILRAVPELVPLVSKATLKAAGDYFAIRNEMWNAVYDAVYDFLNSNAQIGTYSRPMATAVSKAYIDTLETAYTEAGGELPVDDETNTWARGELDAQLGFIDSLFVSLRDLRRDGEFDAADEAEGAATRWANALDGFYNAAKLAGAKNQMLTWTLGATEKHCKDCDRLNGQRHRASWYISHGYFPRKPGSATECGGWNCDCALLTDSGEEFTI